MSSWLMDMFNWTRQQHQACMQVMANLCWNSMHFSNLIVWWAELLQEITTCSSQFMHSCGPMDRHSAFSPSSTQLRSHWSSSSTYDIWDRLIRSHIWTSTLISYLISPFSLPLAHGPINPSPHKSVTESPCHCLYSGLSTVSPLDIHNFYQFHRIPGRTVYDMWDLSSWTRHFSAIRWVT